MHTRIFAAALLAAASAVTLLAACDDDSNANNSSTGGTSGPKSITVKLIALNDFHGYIDPPAAVKVADPNDATKTVSESTGGAPYLATMIQQLKAQNPLNAVVGAGDMVSAS